MPYPARNGHPRCRPSDALCPLCHRHRLRRTLPRANRRQPRPIAKTLGEALFAKLRNLRSEYPLFCGIDLSHAVQANSGNMPASSLAQPGAGRGPPFQLHLEVRQNLPRLVQSSVPHLKDSQKPIQSLLASSSGGFQVEPWSLVRQLRGLALLAALSAERRAEQGTYRSGILRKSRMALENQNFYAVLGGIFSTAVERCPGRKRGTLF
jgi:hypothetical protein